MKKQARLLFGKEESRDLKVLQLVNYDINGAMDLSWGSNRYYITSIDDKIRHIFVYFLKHKSKDEVMIAFRNFHAMAEYQTGKKLKSIR